MDRTRSRVLELMYGLVSDKKLRRALQRLRNGESISWPRLARWEDLDEIRGLLDKFPADPEDNEKEQDDDQIAGLGLEFIPPRDLKYRGQKFILRPKIWLLLKHLLSCRSYSDTLDNMADPVWADHARNVTKEMADSLLRDTRNRFKEHHIPLEIRRHQIYVTLSASPEAARKPKKKT